MNLPGTCQDCRAPVHWNGFRWISEGRQHVCGGHQMARDLVASGKCGAWMPQAHEWCGRHKGHAYTHRSVRAMRNESRMRRVA